jgi:hypothetical protein
VSVPRVISLETVDIVFVTVAMEIGMLYHDFWGMLMIIIELSVADGWRSYCDCHPPQSHCRRPIDEIRYPKNVPMRLNRDYDEDAAVCDLIYTRSTVVQLIRPDQIQFHWITSSM